VLEQQKGSRCAAFLLEGSERAHVPGQNFFVWRIYKKADRESPPRQKL
jgi:hypothetical protein